MVDIAATDWQQYADAVMRLRAEYLFSANPHKIHFHLTTGYDAWFSDYVAGTTFRVRGKQVTPAPKPAKAPPHAALGRYLLLAQNIYLLRNGAHPALSALACPAPAKTSLRRPNERLGRPS